MRNQIDQEDEGALVGGKKVRRPSAMSLEQVARMENEMSNLLGQFKLAEQSHSEDMLNLMLARGYIVKLIDNSRVLRYMQLHYPEVLEEFAKLVEMTTVDGLVHTNQTNHSVARLVVHLAPRWWEATRH